MKNWALNRYVGYSLVLSLVAMASGCTTGTSGMRPMDKMLGGCVGPACDGGSCTTAGCAGGSCTDGSCAAPAGWGNQGHGGPFRGLAQGRGAGGMEACGDGYCSGQCGGQCATAMARLRGKMAAFAQHTHNACANGNCGLGEGPSQGAVTYPYYTTRGPRDYLDPNPPSIGP